MKEFVVKECLNNLENLYITLLYVLYCNNIALIRYTSGGIYEVMEMEKTPFQPMVSFMNKALLHARFGNQKADNTTQGASK